MNGVATAVRPARASGWPTIFIAKHVYQFPTTSALREALRARPMLRQLCGWESPGDIPSEPTFSRAFDIFAQDQQGRCICCDKQHWTIEVADGNDHVGLAITVGDTQFETQWRELVAGCLPSHKE